MKIFEIVALVYLSIFLFYIFWGVLLVKKQKISIGYLVSLLGKEAIISSECILNYYSACENGPVGKDYQRGIFLASPFSEEGLFWAKNSLAKDFCVALKSFLDEEECVISYPDTKDEFLLESIERITGKKAEKWLSVYREKYRSGMYNPSPVRL